MSAIDDPPANMPSFATEIAPQDAQRPLFVGVDVGGTNIKMGLVDDLGRTLAYTKIPTLVERGPQDAVDRIAEAVEQLVENCELKLADFASAGLGTPGTMDIPAGMLLEPPNLPGWWDFPIRDRLAAAIRLPVVFANDGGAAAYGEFWVGTGAELSSIVMLTLGTGVGGGIILNGHSVDGEHSHGSECGHIIIDSTEDARICSCGQPGHLEAYASATAVAKRTEELLQSSDIETSLRARVDNGESVSSLMVAEEAAKGDEVSLRIVDETADYLASAIVSLVHTVDPAGVILGGAMNFGGGDAPLGRRFVDRARKKFQRHAFPVLAEQVAIDFASLGGDAGYLGAAGLARAEHHANKQ